ncbi:MAG TPA: PadR family transcriptional regulator, partial [Anaerolineales bacterium]
MNDALQEPEQLLPLTPAVFNILLALADGEKHGYGIMLEVEANTKGQVIMGPGTLYGSIKRMLQADLIEESDERVDPEMDDPRRRSYYRLTGLAGEDDESEADRARGWWSRGARLPSANTTETGSLSPGDPKDRGS